MQTELTLKKNKQETCKEIKTVAKELDVIIVLMQKTK